MKDHNDSKTVDSDRFRDGFEEEEARDANTNGGGAGAGGVKRERQDHATTHTVLGHTP